MEVSVSLPAGDIEFLDEYVRTSELSSRSAAVHKAVQLLRASELAAAYEQAWDDWATSDDPDLWDVASRDGTS